MLPPTALHAQEQAKASGILQQLTQTVTVSMFLTVLGALPTLQSLNIALAMSVMVPAVAPTVVNCIETGLLKAAVKMQRSTLLLPFVTKLHLAPAKGFVMMGFVSMGGMRLSITTLCTEPLGVSVMFQVKIPPCAAQSAASTKDVQR